jgi:hypothetical protein
MSKWSKAEIALIGAHDCKFPNHEVIHWQQLRAAPQRVRELMRVTNEKMTQVESDPNLSGEGIRQKRADIARETFGELGKLIQPAESAAARRSEKLREKMDAFLSEGKPKDIGEAQIAGEIRAHVARSESPAMAALKLKGDKRAVAAVLGAPCYLSGLNETEASAVRAQVLESTDEHRELRQIEHAVDVCRASIKSAEAMIVKRAQVRQNSLNGSWEIS